MSPRMCLAIFATKQFRSKMVGFRKALSVLFGPAPRKALPILFLWLQGDVAARWRLIAHEVAQRATAAAIERLDLLAYATTRMARRMGVLRGSRKEPGAW